MIMLAQDAESTLPVLLPIVLFTLLPRTENLGSYIVLVTLLKSQTIREAPGCEAWLIRWQLAMFIADHVHSHV